MFDPGLGLAAPGEIHSPIGDLVKETLDKVQQSKPKKRAMDHVREFPTLTFATLSTVTPQL
jgi:hypothetical protein